MKTLKVALVHDYLREYGGAERVVETLHELFPEAPLYTAFVDRESLGIHWERFKSWDIRESVAARIPFIKKLYSPLRLFASYFFEGFDFSEYDVVISSTNMYMAKAVITKPETLHISYIHTPPRSLYGYTTASNWKKNLFIRVFGELLNFRMRQIDFVTAQRPDALVANSREVKNRIQKYYRRDSIVIYPPASISVGTDSRPLAERQYYLYVGRLVYAKHPEIAVQACTASNFSLKIVGSGPMTEKLRAMAGKNVDFLGALSDDDLKTVYAKAKALLYPVEDEDFGIVPVEAMMAGVPVIAHRSGGPIETVIEGETGVFFNDLTKESLLEAITKFESMRFESEKIRKHAQEFSPKKFKEKMLALIEREYKS